MDLLKKELEKKRKVVELAKCSAQAIKPAGTRSNRNVSPSTKHGKRTFMRAAEFRRVQEDQHEKEMDERRESGHAGNLRKRKREEKPAPMKQIGKSSSTKDTSQSKLEKSKDSIDKGKVDSVSPETEEEVKLTGSEITKALREFGIPVWLFGEKNNTQRMGRLREAQESQKATMAGMSEKDDYRLGSGHGIRNPFLGGKKDELVKDTFSKKSIKLSDKSKGEQKANTTSVEKKDKDSIDIDEESNDPHKSIHKFFKTLLRQWEDDLTQRPDSIKRSAVGKNETKTMKQCKDYIRPLFKMCKKRSLDENMTGNILKIVNFCKEGEFVKAHDAYMDVAIGRAAWPIGVTMVGIHARSGRAKIASSNVAHVMNSELQRKYLTSVKRLMSYNQKKRTDVAPSKKVTNL
jgi:pre-mRNA-splicing factor 18